MLLMRSLRLVVAGLLCLLALPATGALASRRASARPAISAIGPGPIGVGQTLTIHGRNFIAGAGRDTVIFMRDRGRPLSVRAAQATTTRLRVVVPAALANALRVSGGVAQPTRFRLRVRARGSSKSPGRSVLIGPQQQPADMPGAGAEGGCAPADLIDAVDALAGTDLAGGLDDALGADPCADAADSADPGADDPGAGDSAADPQDDPATAGAGDPSGA